MTMQANSVLIRGNSNLVDARMASLTTTAVVVHDNRFGQRACVWCLIGMQVSVQRVLSAWTVQRQSCQLLDGLLPDL
jgi:hypothetical protein